MSDTEIFKSAIDKYGADAQTLMVMEEMAELQKELCKRARGAYNVNHIAEEIADVQIMLEQMIILHDCRDSVNRYREWKIKRLASMVCQEESTSDLNDWLSGNGDVPF